MRALKALYEPWEALHVVQDEDDIVVRDDVLHYLHKTYDPTPAQTSTGMSRAEMIHSYEKYRSLLSRLSTLMFPWTASYISDHMSLHTHMWNGGRGIVLSAGDEQIKYILASIKMLRHLGCKLPIEVVYMGSADLGEASPAMLESIPDVITKDIKQLVNDQGWALHGWAGKPFAILLSSFR